MGRREISNRKPSQPPWRSAPRVEEAQARIERFPIRWIHLIGKKTLKINRLEHVLVGKVEQLFRNML